MLNILSTTTWRRPTDNAFMATIVTQIDGGIRHQMFLNGAVIQTTDSPRPYQLGQACDGTINACVHGLLVLYCRAQQINLQQLHTTAYPDEAPYTPTEQQAILQEAIAEGIAVPAQWDDDAFAGLLRSLTEINNHRLADLLSALVEYK